MPDGTELSVLIFKPWLPDGQQRLDAGLPACENGCSPATGPDGGDLGSAVVVKNGHFSVGPFSFNHSPFHRGVFYPVEIDIIDRTVTRTGNSDEEIKRELDQFMCSGYLTKIQVAGDDLPLAPPEPAPAPAPQPSQANDAELRAQQQRPEVKGLGTTVMMLCVMVNCKEMEEKDVVLLINSELQKLTGINPVVQLKVVASAKLQATATTTPKVCASLHEQQAEIYKLQQAAREARMRSDAAMASTPAWADSTTPGPYVRRPGDPEAPVSISISLSPPMSSPYCIGELGGEPANMKRVLYAGASCFLFPGLGAAQDNCKLLVMFCSRAACEKGYQVQTWRNNGGLNISGCAENDKDGTGWHVESLLSGDGANADRGDTDEPRTSAQAQSGEVVKKAFVDCLISQAQSGSYTSYDGGMSAIKLMGQCRAQWDAWQDQCIADGGTDGGVGGCTMQAGMLPKVRSNY